MAWQTSREFQRNVWKWKAGLSIVAEEKVKEEKYQQEAIFCFHTSDDWLLVQLHNFPCIP